MSISLIFRAVIVALSLAGIAGTSVAVALSLIPPFYFLACMMVFMSCGLVAIADI